jgi:hypothetical protein
MSDLRTMLAEDETIATQAERDRQIATQAASAAPYVTETSEEASPGV